MAEFEYRTPVIPQLNFKNISSKRCQILEFEILNYISSTSADPQPDMDYVKKIVSDFTWDTIFEKTGSIYQGCLNA